MTSGPVVLCILDGWGLSDGTAGNAPLLAYTPNFDRLMSNCPSATLITHGPDVGLPEGQMGNSEVGHMNIGAGRVVRMDLGRIDHAIANGSYADTPALSSFMDRLETTGGRAHLLSLFSDGGVHGHISHLIATLSALEARGIESILHLVSDGRDVAPRSALPYLQSLEENLPQTAKVGSLTGRYYALDRDNRWDRVEAAYRVIMTGDAPHHAQNAKEALETAYALDLNDEFIPPFRIGSYSGALEGDGLFCLNFRSDRARQILSALCDPKFGAFKRERKPYWSATLGMVPYSDHLSALMATCFPKEHISNTLGAWVSSKGKTQFRLAETEKYPHVTFFLNGGKETPEQNEERHMPHSPKVATYDLAPEMSCAEVTASCVRAIEHGYDLIVVNFANPDMVGHTGSLKAAIKACEAVDAGLGQILEALDKANGRMLVTADHGNCECMIDPKTGEPHTAHTLNLVPIALVNMKEPVSLSSGGRLADVAPTVLAMLGLEAPQDMTGRSLILQNDI